MFGSCKQPNIAGSKINALKMYFQLKLVIFQPAILAYHSVHDLEGRWDQSMGGGVHLFTCIVRTRDAISALATKNSPNCQPLTISLVPGVFVFNLTYAPMAPILSASGFGVGFGCLNTFSKGIWSTRVFLNCGRQMLRSSSNSLFFRAFFFVWQLKTIFRIDHNAVARLTKKRRTRNVL